MTPKERLIQMSAAIPSPIPSGIPIGLAIAPATAPMPQLTAPDAALLEEAHPMPQPRRAPPPGVAAVSALPIARKPKASAAWRPSMKSPKKIKGRYLIILLLHSPLASCVVQGPATGQR